MSFFKNSQVAKEFKVSNTTVTNWIEAAEKGLVDIKLATIGTRKVIIDSLENRELLQVLKNKGKKHVGKTSRVVTKVDPRFYEIFDWKQIAEIYTAITSKHEIPYKYTYFDIGADLWDQNYKFILNSTVITPNNDANEESNLTVQNLQKIISQFSKYKKINVIDVGCGNGLPAVPIIEELLNSKIEISYTAVDISQRMLDIDKDHILKIFPDLDYDQKIIDLEKENLAELLLDKKEDDFTANFVMFVGGTLGNYKKDGDIFKKLRESMTKNDFLMIGNALADEDSKISSYQANPYHYHRSTWILEMFGLKGLYPDTAINVYNPAKLAETRKMRIEKDATVVMKYKNHEIKIELNKLDEILVYKFSWYTEMEMVKLVVDNHFSIEQFMTNRERSYAIMILGTAI
jgi:SAM-dependent methyltransferase